MEDRSRIKRPRDPNQLAYQIMLESTGQIPKAEPPAQRPKNPAAIALGRLGGLKGGAARAAALSPKKRSQLAARLQRRDGARSRNGIIAWCKSTWGSPIEAQGATPKDASKNA